MKKKQKKKIKLRGGGGWGRTSAALQPLAADMQVNASYRGKYMCIIDTHRAPLSAYERTVLPRGQSLSCTPSHRTLGQTKVKTTSARAHNHARAVNKNHDSDKVRTGGQNKAQHVTVHAVQER
jgi:hypothetical protein